MNFIASSFFLVTGAIAQLTQWLFCNYVSFSLSLLAAAIRTAQYTRRAELFNKSAAVAPIRNKIN
jgi:hypothetical protein